MKVDNLMSKVARKSPLTSILTMLVLGVLLIVGSVAAVSFSTEKADKSSIFPGEKVTFSGKVHFNSAEREYPTSMVFYVIDEYNNIVDFCSFLPNGIIIFCDTDRFNVTLNLHKAGPFDYVCGPEGYGGTGYGGTGYGGTGYGGTGYGGTGYGPDGYGPGGYGPDCFGEKNPSKIDYEVTWMSFDDLTTKEIGGFMQVFALNEDGDLLKDESKITYVTVTPLVP